MLEQQQTDSNYKSVQERSGPRRKTEGLVSEKRAKTYAEGESEDALETQPKIDIKDSTYGERIVKVRGKQCRLREQGCYDID